MAVFQRDYGEPEGQDGYLLEILHSQNSEIYVCGTVLGSAEFELNQDSWVLKVDEWGCLEPGCQLDIGEISPSHEIVVAPLPAKDYITVSGLKMAFSELNIYTAQGQIVSEYQGLNGLFTTELNISDMSYGYYLIQLVGTEQTISVPFIKF